MEITFEKKPKIEIPDNLPIKAVWMTGDATVTKWNTPFKIAFLYNPDEKEGTFVWEGHLDLGEIKFPLSNTEGFECDYLMPEVNGTLVTNALKWYVRIILIIQMRTTISGEWMKPGNIRYL